MNFEFLKDLTGLGYIYENCSNAEKLAISMPVQSVFTSRKSAELLAKFIYLAAHNQEVEALTFADILSDYTVQKYINNRSVMNAFHHIRKSGNRAVHGEDTASSEDAISVLNDLHFVAGETACTLGLIEKYPRFDNDIVSYSDAISIEEQDLELLVQKMFREYIEKFDAQIERDNYYNQRVDHLLADFSDYTSPIRFIPGIVDLNESIEFKKKPISKSTIQQIQEHFAYLGMQMIKKLNNENEEDGRPFEYEGRLTIYGENGYRTTDLYEFIYGILHDLADADGFEIVSLYRGPSIAPWFDNNVREEFSETVTKFDERERFIYKKHEFLDNHGEGYCVKIVDGKKIDLQELYTPAIVDADFGDYWWSYQLCLFIDFDFEKHHDVLDALHEAVRRNIDPDELQYCEQCWDDEDYNVLVNSVEWDPRKLREVQNFLDEINLILKPIMTECNGRTSGQWFIKEPPFAEATLEWTKDGFRIVGTGL